MERLNMDSLDEAYIWRDALGLTTRLLGRAAGSERLYVNIDTVPPGAYSTKYHSHTMQEEFFLVLSGSGTLRLNDESREVVKGDFFAKPGGKGIAHTFFNSGVSPMVILDVGTAEPEDTCCYPDEGILFHKWSRGSEVYRQSDRLEGWSSAPNEQKREADPESKNT